MMSTKTRDEGNVPTDMTSLARIYAVETVERVTLSFLAQMYAETIVHHMQGRFDDEHMRAAHLMTVARVEGEITAKLPATVYFKKLADTYRGTIGEDFDGDWTVRCVIRDAMCAIAAMI